MDAAAAVKAVYDSLTPLDENVRGFVLATVAALLGKSQQTQAGASATGAVSKDSALDKMAPAQGSVTAQAFIKTKQPKSERERVLCLAYYLTHHKNQPKFKTRELTLLNSQAGEPDLSNGSMIVSNLEKQRLLGQTGRGYKRITNHGDAVVEALPDREAVKVAFSQRRKPYKRKAKKTAK